MKKVEKVFVNNSGKQVQRKQVHPKENMGGIHSHDKNPYSKKTLMVEDGAKKVDSNVEQHLNVGETSQKDSSIKDASVAQPISNEPTDSVQNDYDAEAQPQPLSSESSEEVDDSSRDNDLSWLEGAEEIRPNQRGIATSGVLTIVNNKNSNRVTLAKKILEKLGNPVSVTIRINKENELVINSCEDEEGHYLKGVSQNTIYSKELVDAITDLYNLNFSNRTSNTVGKVTYRKIKDVTYACISK